MEKKLVFTDHHQIQALRSDLEKKAKFFNFVLKQFHIYQSFKTISNLGEAIELLSAPLQTFDKTIIENSNMPTLGGLSANVDAVCVIYNVDRSGYLHAIQDIKEKFTFDPKDALKFDGGVFSIDLEKFNLQAEKYSVYAESPQQIALVDHWETLVKTMNNHVKNNWVSSFNAVQVAESFGVLYNRFTLVFELDYRKIADLINN